MRVLCACEESQAVTSELRRLGHESYSCDLLPCSGGHPEWHIQEDALEVVKMDWDMILTLRKMAGATFTESDRRAMEDGLDVIRVACVQPVGTSAASRVPGRCLRRSTSGPR